MIAAMQAKQASKTKQGIKAARIFWIEAIGRWR
jgi:hypothetical protein